MKESEQLQELIDGINRNNWIKHSSGDPNVGHHCLGGHLSYHKNKRLYFLIRDKVVSKGWRSIPNFNDDFRTTLEDIKLMVKEVIYDLEQKGE